MSRWMLVLLAGAVGCDRGTEESDVETDDTFVPGETDTDAPLETDDTEPADTDVPPDTDDTDVPEPGPVAVYDIQTGVVPTGEHVLVESAVITAVAPEGLFVSDMAGGPWRGIFVYLGTPVVGTWHDAFDVADLIDITGTVTEYFDNTEIEVDWETGFISIAGTAEAPIPEIVVTPELLATAETAEPFEGVLVAVEDVVVVQAPDANGEWQVTAEGSDTIVIIDDLVSTLQSTIREADEFDRIVGPVHHALGTYRIEPRNAADLVGLVPAVIQVDDLLAGELVVTEIMAEPVACSAQPEYVEVYNNTGATVDLLGLKITDDSATATIGTSVLIPSGEVALLTRKPSSGSWCYTDTPGDYQYGSGLALSTSDYVILAGPTLTIDKVDFRGWTVPSGASLSLDDDFFDASDNDGQGFWCAATAPIGTTGDFGSPDFPNPSCE